MHRTTFRLNAPVQIGPHSIRGRCVLAPMAGLSDQVFRNICRNFGAALAVSEMNTADTELWSSRKSQPRLNFTGENGLRILQIAGSDPTQLAVAAKAAEQLGADIVDINMGCPAKKVCKKLSGSALLKDEALVTRILEAVTVATSLPVTLKIRTGWDVENRNGVRIAQIAEQAGIQALAVHGRTRACMFTGDAEYATIRAIKSAVTIPVFANGDICSANKAKEVLEQTGADGVMIGRGALGQPWIFNEINHYLNDCSTSEQYLTTPPSRLFRRDIITSHLEALYRLYGEERGVRVGRKHLTWYCKYLDDAKQFRDTVVRVKSAKDQLQLTTSFFNQNEFRKDAHIGAHPPGNSVQCLTDHQKNVTLHPPKRVLRKSRTIRSKAATGC
ncbi:MAG: tRNA dihydrouridine synthase DusB [Gammaproteobacteria bacterium]|nr:MAG: tRNA dihydrouridine synthase DusB [Gammaproteobacteria bacterium]